ncbi:PAS domain-containing sensor histidine kinase [Melittangium boletus DSM 14713]|uniref:histidine kinase n=2 Tax=Melittangium boletus TaxID=83453 RepID=A0A250IAW2_9BACT|nr:PAS domain-containing sensor histidine kinase [Melittangium boletus DSM 14713]
MEAAKSSPTTPDQDVTVEELLQVISRLTASEPHVHCREGGGPLAPLAKALNRLSNRLSAAPAGTEDIFGPQTLVAQSQAVMITCDTEARIRFINATFPGLTREAVMGTSLYLWLRPEIIEPTRELIRGVLTTGEFAKIESQGMSEFGAPWLSTQLGPIKEGENIVGFTAINTDITELKRTQLHLERSNRELESFAYVASHDLQEPLRKILTFGERLKSTSTQGLGAEGRDYVERMLKAAARMRGLIEDLLAYSRVSSSNRPFTSVNLAAVAHEVLEDLSAMTERTGASVTLGELPVLEADPTQMRQLLQNLVANALKFHREGVPPVVSVRATIDPRLQRCELRVEDNGIGFEEKYTDRIFNVFQRLQGRTQYEGSGIGLAICRKIAERHGGGISARSTPGEGSTFHVTLPLRQHATP